VNGQEREPTDTTMTETTMTDVLAQYAAAGFGGDAFAAAGGEIICGTCSSCVAPAQVAIEAISRLEGASDPSDMAAVLAIVCPICQTKATLVLKFGPEASVDEVAIWQHLSPINPTAEVSDRPREADQFFGESERKVEPGTVAGRGSTDVGCRGDGGRE
jgi:hypothetical protein